MKKWYRYLVAGVLVLLTLCVAGCGGVSHKSPEKVTEELIQSYVDGKESKVKDCYNQKDNTEADLQTEITATLNYFKAHNPKKYLFRTVRFFQRMISMHMYILHIIWFWRMTRSIHV